MPNNEDRLEHNVARIFFLYTFDLNRKDVTDATEAEDVTEWLHKHVVKDFIMETLKCNLKQGVDEQ
jgi:hypothetical protein